MKKSQLFFLLAGLLLLLDSCDPGAERDNWTVYETDEFRIEYPKIWELDDQAEEPFHFFLFTSNSKTYFDDNLNLVSEKLPSNISLDQYMKITEPQIQKLNKGVTIIESNRKKGKNGTYHEIIFVGSTDGFNCKWKQFFKIEDSKAYVMSFTALEETYDQSIDEVNDVFESLTIKK